MLILPSPSATFDERLIQRSGSGETDNLSSNSGLATPQDEDIQPLGSSLDLEHAAKTIATRMDRQSSLGSRKEYQVSNQEEQTSGKSRLAKIPPGIMAKMISSESSSSVSRSPEFEDPEVTHIRAKDVYNLPNRHISIEIQDRENETTNDDSFLNQTGAAQSSVGLDSLFDKRWTREQIGKAILRVFFFLPWCIAVGGSIILCPSKLDAVTFQTGYLDPLFGIYRFAHWADRTFEHIVIFATFLGFLAWFSPTIGIMLGCAVAALAVNAWHDFKLDPSVPLGEDDRQSVYLTMTRFWLTDEFLSLRRENRGFVLEERSPGGKKSVELGDSEEE